MIKNTSKTLMLWPQFKLHKEIYNHVICRSQLRIRKQMDIQINEFVFTFPTF